MKHLGMPARLVAYRALTDAAGKGAFFIVTVLAARQLSQLEFGLFSLGTTIGWMCAVASDAGIQMHVARTVARQPEHASHVVEMWSRARATTAAVALILVGVALPWTSLSVAGRLAVLGLVALYLLNGLIEFFYYVFRGLGRTDIESTLTLGQRLPMLALAAAVLVWRPGVLALAGAMALPALVTLWYVWRRAIELANASVPPGRAGRREPAHSLRASWADVLPIGAGIVFSALYFRIDILLLQAWSGTNAVGQYNAVFRLVEALRLLPAAVLAVAMPALCRAATTRPLRLLSGALAGGAAILAAALMAGADWLIPFLYGPVFADAVPAFRILLGAFPLMALNYALTHQLIGWNNHRGYAAICLAALVFNLALNMRLIPAMSIAGAAWATLWTEVVLTAGCVSLLSRQRLATDPQPSAAAAR